MHNPFEKLRDLIGTLPFHLTGRDLVYPGFILIVYGVWVCYMGATDRWFCLTEYWQMPVTMLFGSMVAGSTPTGGAAVAFPVFTKVLDIAPTDARTFGLMIQSVGMTSAALYIWHRRIPVLRDVILHASVGGVTGALFGVVFIELPAGYPRLLFTTVASLFAIALIYMRIRGGVASNPRIASFGVAQRTEFVILGFVGGLVANATGSGIDIVVFMALALSYRICEQVSIPTTVVCMAINSIVGFSLHATLVHDVSAVWGYWLASVPVVAIGAPLGAFLVTRCSQNQLLVFILLLIAADFVTTALVVEYAPGVIKTIVTVATICLCTFSWMIYRGERKSLNSGYQPNRGAGSDRPSTYFN